MQQLKKLQGFCLFVFYLISMLWIEFCALPPKSFVEALIPNVTYQEIGPYKEITKVRWDYEDRAPMMELVAL